MEFRIENGSWSTRALRGSTNVFLKRLEQQEKDHKKKKKKVINYNFTIINSK